LHVGPTFREYVHQEGWEEIESAIGTAYFKKENPNEVGILASSLGFATPKGFSFYSIEFRDGKCHFKQRLHFYCHPKDHFHPEYPKTHLDYRLQQTYDESKIVPLTPGVTDSKVLPQMLCNEVPKILSAMHILYGERGKNVALNKVVTASSTANPYPDPYIGEVEHSPSFVTDGDKSTPGRTWSPESGNAGEWLQIDLGEIYPINEIHLYPHTRNPSEFYKRFHFEVSKTGEFKGEQTTILTEDDLISSLKAERERLGSVRVYGNGRLVMYEFDPVEARYIKIVADAPDNWVNLQEVEIFTPLRE